MVSTGARCIGYMTKIGGAQGHTIFPYFPYHKTGLNSLPESAIKLHLENISGGEEPMAERQAGITALITAYARAYHATHDSPKIFDDFLIDQIYSAEEHSSFDQSLAGLIEMIDPALAATHPDPETALAAVIQLHNGPVTLSRSRYTEDNLEQALAQGAQQYVILGAGFDTFAFRRPDLVGKLEVFEVDHPVTQAMKRRRVGNAGWALPANLHFAPVDFTQESLTAALGRTPYNPAKLSFISWLGVTFYLAREVVFATLRAIADLAPEGSQVVFDYMDADAFEPEKAGKRVRLMQNIASMVGEPMKSGFDPQTLAGDLESLGFRLVENLGPEEIEARYFQNRTDHYHAFEHVHFARATIS
jgi:methyltransferase (TIGR00027 family)